MESRTEILSVGLV